VKSDYFGFNIVEFGDRFIAIAQALGPIDVATADLSVFEADRVVVAAASQLEAELMIDGLRLEATEGRLEALEAELTALELVCVERETRIMDLEQRIRGKQDEAQVLELRRELEALRGSSAKIQQLERELKEGQHGLERLRQELSAAMASAERDRANLSEQLHLREIERDELSAWIKELQHRLAIHEPVRRPHGGERLMFRPRRVVRVATVHDEGCRCAGSTQA
jgi:predicted RNase H-like nuclease (RuvC/YqgF family)